jgi:uncharacterized membrane protein (DUF106 family)
MSGPLDPLINWFVSLFGSYIPTSIPGSTFFIVSVAIVLSLVSATAAKLLVDYDMVKGAFSEYQAFQREFTKATKANDTQTLSKLNKKKAGIMKSYSRASMEQFKVTAVTFLPFLLVWYSLNSVFGKDLVAIAPFTLPFVGTQFTFFYWYFLCSFAVNLPMMRLFRIGMQSD